MSCMSGLRSQFSCSSTEICFGKMHLTTRALQIQQYHPQIMHQDTLPAAARKLTYLAMGATGLHDGLCGLSGLQRQCIKRSRAGRSKPLVRVPGPTRRMISTRQKIWVDTVPWKIFVNIQIRTTIWRGCLGFPPKFHRQGRIATRTLRPFHFQVQHLTSGGFPWQDIPIPGNLASRGMEVAVQIIAS